MFKLLVHVKKKSGYTCSVRSNNGSIILLLASGGKMKSLRGQALGVAMLRIWNRLPLGVRNKENVNQAAIEDILSYCRFLWHHVNLLLIILIVTY